MHETPPATSPGSITALTPAGFATRSAAFLVDVIVLWALCFPLWAFGAGLGAAMFIAVDLAYHVILEGGRLGQTVGKRIAGIRVADAISGGPIGRGRALIRHIGRWFSSFCCGLGYLWMLWDPNRQTWHDKMADAVVVRARVTGMIV